MNSKFDIILVKYDVIKEFTKTEYNKSRHPRSPEFDVYLDERFQEFFNRIKEFATKDETFIDIKASGLERKLIHILCRLLNLQSTTIKLNVEIDIEDVNCD